MTHGHTPPGHTTPLTPALLGRVVVVAGEEPRLATVAAAAADAGALVAVVSRTLPADVAGEVRFSTDPADASVWVRVGMHVEQHLGPVDGVATDAAAAPTLVDVFDADLERRGHGHVAVVAADDDATDVVSRLCTRRAAPPRSRDAAPGR